MMLVIIKHQQLFHIILQVEHWYFQEHRQLLVLELIQHGLLTWQVLRVVMVLREHQVVQVQVELQV